MRSVMVRYKVHPEHAEENARLARAVYAELRERAPAGVRYATYRLPDGVSFVHVATHEQDGPNQLTALPSFQRFVSGIKDRCLEQPLTTELDPLDSYVPAR